MLNVGVIGIGNAGSQVAVLASEKQFDVIAINSSDRDLDLVKDKIPTLVVGNTKGAGKDRNIAKKFISSAIEEVVLKHLNTFVRGKDHVFIISSTGGGTGSGMSPLLRDMLSKVYKNTTFHLVAILPRLTESVAAQDNTVAYGRELIKTNPSYMIYDNGKYDSASVVSLPKINEEIVDHLQLIRGDYQSSTALGTIDEQDMSKIITTPGRIVVGGVQNYTEKDNDQMPLLEAVSKSIEEGSHAELQSDRRVVRQGLLFDKITDRLYAKVDSGYDQIVDRFGEAIDGFEHLMTVKEEQNGNSTYLIMSGLSFPDDRLQKILDRIQEAEFVNSTQPNSKILSSETSFEGLNAIKEARQQTASTSMLTSPLLDDVENGEDEEHMEEIPQDIMSLLDGYDID